MQATTEAQSPKSPTVIARAVPQPSLLKNFKILLFRLFVDAIRVLIWIILSNKNEKDDSFSRLLYFERNLLLKKKIKYFNYQSHNAPLPLVTAKYVNSTP